MDNKYLKNEEKVVSSSYPPRSSNRGHLAWKSDKIRVFQSFSYVCDVNMMLKIEPATFPTLKWIQLKSLSKCGSISLGLPGWQAVGPPLEGLCPSVYIETRKGIWEKRAEWMLTIEGLIAVINLVLTAFGLGYAIGSKDNHKTQKQPPWPRKLSGYFCVTYCVG